jgi:cytochrome P450
MFSRRRIAEFQPVVRDKVNKLCNKIVQYHQDGNVLRLNRAWSAMTADIITEYAFARSYDQLDSPEFEETYLEALQTIYTTGHFGLHFPILFPLLNSLPDWLTLKLKPELLSIVKVRRDLGVQVSEIRQGINESHKMVEHPTIFRELIESDLPLQEKSDERLGDEAQLIIAAGLVTTSWALAVASFHIVNKPEIFLKLRKELEAAIPDPALMPVDWLQLEKLPYLNGCVHEAVRLSYGVTTRSPRLQPEAEIKYKEWTIPRNTPVSMTNVDVCHDENIFPDSKSFVPERWIENTRLDRYFVSFGKGSRQCLGIKYASFLFIVGI